MRQTCRSIIRLGCAGLAGLALVACSAPDPSPRQSAAGEPAAAAAGVPGSGAPGADEAVPAPGARSPDPSVPGPASEAGPASPARPTAVPPAARTGADSPSAVEPAAAPVEPEAVPEPGGPSAPGAASGEGEPPGPDAQGQGGSPGDAAEPSPPAEKKPPTVVRDEPAPPPAPDVVVPAGPVRVAATKSGLTDTGADKCGKCHRVEHASWKESAHAALETPLDCEACHGPGSEYQSMKVMKDPDAATAAGLVRPDAAFCARCHVRGWDDAMLANAHAHKPGP